MKNLKYIAIVTLSLATILAGCRSARQTVEPVEPPVANPLSVLEESYVPWENVEMPVRFELKSPKKFSVSGTAKMANEESILFSFRFFGMEMGNLWLSSDSVQAIVKPMNVYYKEDLSAFSAAIGVSVSDIQNLLLGRVFEVKPNSPFKASFFAGFNAEGVAMLDSVNIVPEGHAPVTVTYGISEATPCGPVASSMNTEANIRDNEILFTCRWDLDRAKWNTGKSPVAPRVPSGMQRLTSADLIKIIKKL